MLGSKIGEGGNSEVFEWGTDQVIKLAKPNTNEAELQHELSNTLVVWENGLPVPKPYEVVYVGDRPGLIFEKVVGESPKDRLFKQMLEGDRFNLDESDIKASARILSEIHSMTIDGLSSQRDFLRRQIMNPDYLNDVEKASVLEIMDNIPTKKQLCHGDPNPNNFMVSYGRHMVIDWNDATIGNPEADIAEYILTIRHAILPPETPIRIVEQFDLIREKIIQTFLEEYTSLTGMTEEDIRPWLVIIGARKLAADAISNEEKLVLLGRIKRELKSGADTSLLNIKNLGR